jgi:heptaprenyl diphosphate synthase
MNQFWKDEPELLVELDQVRSLIRTTVEQSHGFIRSVLISHVNSMGKMLRPALALISSRLGEMEERDTALRIASVLEMVHLASLVHDDIIDSAKTRRGLPTIYAQVGAKQAVLAGDYLLARAMALVGGKEGDLNASAVANAFSRLCESELEQDSALGEFFISPHTYLRRIAGKTASLFALSCYAGAAVASAPLIEQQRLHRIGYAMGMAFQIQDDVLDYTGNESDMGKQIGKDLKCGVPTLPLIRALEEEKKLPETSHTLHTLLTKGTKLSSRDIKKAVSLVVELGGVQMALAVEENYKKRAERDIDAIPDPIVAGQLRRLFSRLSTRAS